MSCWAAATPNASINSREDLNVDIIAMRFWAELAYGKSIGGRADQNGRFFRKAIKLYGTLLSQTWRSRLARLEEVGRRASAYQAWKKRNARNRCLLGPP